LSAVKDLAVGRKLLDARVAEPVLVKLFDDVIRGGTKSARAAHAMVPRDVLEIALRRLARQFLRQRSDHGLGQHGRLICVVCRSCVKQKTEEYSNQFMHDLVSQNFDAC